MKTSKILEHYGYTDLYYEPDRIDYPSWAVIKDFASILDELTSHFISWETEAYRGHHGNPDYVIFVLDLGDRPMRIHLEESGAIRLTTPIFKHIPKAESHFILKELASGHTTLVFYLDEQDVLVVVMEVGLDKDYLLWAIPYFIEQTSRAKEDFLLHLQAEGYFDDTE